MTIWRFFALPVLLLALAITGSAQGPTFTTLDFPSAFGTTATGINDSGTIVGSYVDSGGSHGFTYVAGTYTTLDDPNGTDTQLIGINNLGQVLGSYKPNVGIGTRYFIYSGGSFTLIGLNGNAPPPSNPTFECHTDTFPFQCSYFSLGAVRGINNAGQIAGFYNPGFSGTHGVFGYPPLGTSGSTTLPSGSGFYKQVDCPGASSTQATGISSGFLPGVAGFCDTGLFSAWVFGIFASYDTFSYSGATATTGWGMNDAFQVVGSYQPTSSPTVQYGLLRNGNAGVSLIPSGATFSRAQAINNHSVIVGYYQDSGGGTHGFVTVAPPPAGQISKSLGSGKSLSSGEMCPVTCGAVTHKGSTFSGDPIDIGSGNMFFETTDYGTAGQNPLAFSRYHNTRGNAPGISTFATSLGVNWRSTFDRYLQLVSGSIVIAERGDGQQLIFTLIGSTWTPNADVDMTLTQSGSTWTLTAPDDAVETYTAITASEAQLNSIAARNGYTQTMHYNGSNQLTSVTDSYSRTLTLAYNTNSTLNTLSTPDSTTITFGYTSGGSGQNLTSVSFPTATTSTVSYVYENTSFPNSLSGIVDENGNRYATWTFDSQGRGLTSSLGGSSLNANLTTITYDDSTGARTVTNALGVVDSYTFSMLQRAPKVTQISRAATATTAAATRTFTYDSNGYMASATDWNGNSTTYTNNSHGFPTQIVEASSSSVARTMTIAYDTTFVHLPASIVTPSATESFTFDTNGNPLTKTLTDTTTTTSPYSTNGQTRIWTFTWSNHLLASVQNPRTDVTSTTAYGYGSDGALTSVTNALSQTTSITSHTRGGQPLTVVDPNSVTTTLTYDARQRPLTSSVSTASGARTTMLTYDAAGNLTQTKLPDNSTLTNVYDNAHRPTSITDILSASMNYTINALGNVTQALWKDSGTTKRSHTSTFDALGRVKTDTGGASQVTTLTYDSNGNPLTVKDGLNHTSTQTFDALNRLSTVTDANSGVTTTTYDAHDRPLTVTDAESHVTSYVYDGFGDVIQQASPDSGTTVYHYDKQGNLTQKVDAASVTANFTYDKLDRILTRAYPSDSTQNVSFAYDETTIGSSNPIGRLTTVTDNTGYFNRSYDERGNLQYEKRFTSAGNYFVHYSYDRANRLTNIDYPDSMNMGYMRDDAGNINGLLYVPAGGSSTVNIGSPEFLPFGPLKRLAFSNGVTITYAHDQDYRLTGITDNSSIQSLAYTYDAANNITAIADSITASNSQTLGYDVINRLTSATSGTGGYGSLAWTYDKVANRLTQTAGSTTTTYGYTSGTNRLASLTIGSTTTTVSTNANGNITSIPPANSSSAAAFAYSAANRLASVTGSPLAATYVYDGAGRRIKKTQGSSAPIYYTYDQGGNMIEEIDNGVVTDYIYMGTTLIATYVPGASPPTTGAVYYVHSDQLGTPQQATDGNKSVVWNANYQPFGSSFISGSINQNMGLPGQYDDAETRFSHNGARDYMPNLGRYLQTDIIGLGGGPNTYAYVNGNPIRYADPSGTCAPYCITVPAGVVISMAGAYFSDPKHFTFDTALTAGVLGAASGFAVPALVEAWGAGCFAATTREAMLKRLTILLANNFFAAVGGALLSDNLNGNPVDLNKDLVLGGIAAGVPLISGEGVVVALGTGLGTVGEAVFGTYMAVQSAVMATGAAIPLSQSQETANHDEFCKTHLCLTIHPRPQSGNRQ